mmetsp:Transcript_29283/g.59885  ORF Transcript_29283/g.59885 Transcript_29283/m.59885 type:complete len:264 (-) Transcript_29283:1197-1988(-)
MLSPSSEEEEGGLKAALKSRSPMARLTASSPHVLEMCSSLPGSALHRLLGCCCSSDGSRDDAIRSEKHRLRMSTTSWSQKSMRRSWTLIGISVSVVTQPPASSMRRRSSERAGLWMSTTSLQKTESVRPSSSAGLFSVELCAMCHASLSASSRVQPSQPSQPSLSTFGDSEDLHMTPLESPRLATTTALPANITTRAVAPQSHSRPPSWQRMQNSSSSRVMADISTLSARSWGDRSWADSSNERLSYSSFRNRGNFSAAYLAA